MSTAVGTSAEESAPQTPIAHMTAIVGNDLHDIRLDQAIGIPGCAAEVTCRDEWMATESLAGGN
jgi:hypothetical protein